MIVELFSQAVDDIEEIIRYTDANFGHDQTAKYIDGLYYSFELLKDNPNLGRTWSNNKRRYVYRMHYVYYRILNDRIFITQIKHTSLI